jgi:hypothetical protein
MITEQKAKQKKEAQRESTVRNSDILMKLLLILK